MTEIETLTQPHEQVEKVFRQAADRLFDMDTEYNQSGDMICTFRFRSVRHNKTVTSIIVINKPLLSDHQYVNSATLYGIDNLIKKITAN